VFIPRIVYLYWTWGIKCEIYGGLWEQMDQVAFVDGQCATIN
jgi:hypothetical protein